MKNHPAFVVLAGVLLSGPGCLGDEELGDEAGTPTGADAGTSGSQTSGVTTSEATDDTSGAQTSSTGAEETDGSDTSETDDTGGLRCETDSIPAIGSVLEVSVELINDTEQPFYLTGRGTTGCTPFGIRRDGRWQPLDRGHFCGCECHPPPTIDVQVLVLMPGESTTVSWDGRTLAPYIRQSLCVEAPWPTRCVAESDGAAQPLEPGAVELVIPVYDTEPPYTDRAPGGFLDVCVGEWSFAVELDLGDEDLSLDVLLSTVVLR